MVQVNKSIYYYLILFSTFIFTFALIPIVFEIIQQKITSNIPYISLFFFIIGFLIYLYIAITRGYYIHIFFYTIGLLCISIIIFLKRNFDKNNITINKNIINKNIIFNYLQEEEE
jgi:uncharacterized protein with PQ loop repeat